MLLKNWTSVGGFVLEELRFLFVYLILNNKMVTGSGKRPCNQTPIVDSSLLINSETLGNGQSMEDCSESAKLQCKAMSKQDPKGRKEF